MRKGDMLVLDKGFYGIFITTLTDVVKYGILASDFSRKNFKLEKY